MSSDAVGPVTVAEVMEVVGVLRVLADRAAETGQQMFHFVLSVGAESLADNMENAVDMEDDND